MASIKADSPSIFFTFVNDAFSIETEVREKDSTRQNEA